MPEQETCDVRLNFRVTVRQAEELARLATESHSSRSAEFRAWLNAKIAEREEQDAGHGGRSDGQAQNTDH